MYVADTFGDIGRQVYDSSIVIASSVIGLSQGGVEGFVGGSLGSGLVTGISCGFRYGDPNLENSPNPRGFWDTVWDIAQVGLSIKAFNDKPNFWNGVGLVVDTLSLLAVGVPAGGGMAIRAATKADDIGDVAKGFRYVGKREGKAILKNHKIPNVNQAGKAKNIFYTDEYFDSAATAKNGLSLKTKPTYRVTFDKNNVKPIYGGITEGGSAEYITDQAIDALSVEKLK
jgi:hypothetical protein